MTEVARGSTCDRATTRGIAMYEVDDRQEVLSMGCEPCQAALPYLFGFPPIARSALYHSTLYKCASCGTYYEQIAEEWRGPHERTEEEVRARFPELFE